MSQLRPHGRQIINVWLYDVPTDCGMDNLSVDMSGQWVSISRLMPILTQLNPSPGFPNALIITFQHFSIPCPSNVLRFS
jgi:hypothetical protein